MNILHALRAAALISLGLASIIVTAGEANAMRPASAASTAGEAKIPQVIITAKRLSAAEKARMAEEDATQESKKSLVKKTPAKSGKPSGTLG